MWCEAEVESAGRASPNFGTRSVGQSQPCCVIAAVPCHFLSMMRTSTIMPTRFACTLTLCSCQTPRFHRQRPLRTSASRILSCRHL